MELEEKKDDSTEKKETKDNKTKKKKEKVEKVIQKAACLMYEYGLSGPYQ
jgi:hypothetical protein